MILVVFSEKELTLKILFSVENVIVHIEMFIDSAISFITNFSTNFSMPMFTLLLTNSALMVQGGSLEQLKRLDSICDEYLERIRGAREKDPSAAVVGFSNIRLNSPEEEVSKCTVGIMMKAPRIPGEKPSYFQHQIRYNESNKELEWTAQGDDNSHKDIVKKAKVVNTPAERTIEVEMSVNKKVLQFADMPTFLQWASKFQLNVTTSTKNK